MASDIMIRKASKDYVCSCCGHVIRKGDEYLDKVILNTGKIVKHDRYHDECPKASKLLTVLFKNNNPVVCAHDGIKYYLEGMRYSCDTKKAIIKEWDTETYFLVDEDTFNKEWTCYD